MNRTFSNLALALLVCAAAPAASINTTLTVNATATPNSSLSAVAIAGTVSFTGGIGTGKIASTVPLDLTATSVVADYTITLDAGGTLSGKLTIPLSILGGGPATVNVTITGGTGTYSNATSGTTPIALAGSVSGDVVSGFKLTSFTGSGTITTGGTPPPPVPTITDVLDAGSYTKNIAQGSIFVVKGTTLSASGFTQMSFPLPTSSSGVNITFTPAAGGTGTVAYLVYLYNQGGVNQLAGILPSGVAAGNYNVTVTNGTVSAPFATQVVQRKIGLITADSSGSGLAVIQNYISPSQLDIDRLTTFSSGGFTFSPSRPGQVLIAWATGMGPVTGGDNTASPGFDFNANGVTVRVLVGGVSITPLYAGRAPGLAGADQINFALPSNIPTGCTVSFQVSVNGALSNPSFIAIAPDASATACVMPGFTTDQLRNFDNGGTYTSGAFSITQFAITAPSVGSVKSNSIGGAFSRISGFQLASASQGNVSVIQSGSCQVIQATTTGTTTVTGGTVTNLDAGTVTINGPAGSSLTNQALTKTDNTYSLTNIEGFAIPGQTTFSLPAGTYTLNGPGGNDVGSFSTSITLGSPLTLSSPLPATVTRSAGLTLDWTGGNASDLVEIIGSSSTSTGTGSGAVTNSSSFICVTTAGQRTFTVPASILIQLGPTTTGSLFVASGVTPATFKAPLKAGGSIDAGAFTSFVGIGGTPAYQ